MTKRFGCALGLAAAIAGCGGDDAPGGPPTCSAPQSIDASTLDTTGLQIPFQTPCSSTVTAIDFWPTRVVRVGETFALDAFPHRGRCILYGKQATFTSSSPAVEVKGTVAVGREVGTSTITATFDGVSASVDVRVVFPGDAPVELLLGGAMYRPGTDLPLAAVAVDGGGANVVFPSFDPAGTTQPTVWRFDPAQGWRARERLDAPSIVSAAPISRGRFLLIGAPTTADGLVLRVWDPASGLGPASKVDLGPVPKGARPYTAVSASHARVAIAVNGSSTLARWSDDAAEALPQGHAVALLPNDDTPSPVVGLGIDDDGGVLVVDEPDPNLASLRATWTAAGATSPSAVAIPLPDDPHILQGVQVAMRGPGEGVVTYMDFGPDSNRLFAADFAAGGFGGPLHLVSELQEVPVPPRVVATDFGAVIVQEHASGRHLLAIDYTPGGCAAVTLDRPEFNYNALSHVGGLARAADGTIVLLVDEYNANLRESFRVVRRAPGGAWVDGAAFDRSIAFLGVSDVSADGTIATISAEISYPTTSIFGAVVP